MAFVSITDIVYPVGSVYLSTTTVSPATLFGGTWAQIQNTLIGASGNTYGAVNQDGGDTKIRNYNVPEHIHNCVASINAYNILHNINVGWAGFWYSDASSGNKWSVGTYGTDSQSQEKWLYAANLTGIDGNPNRDYIPYHYNCNIWRRTA